MDLSLNTVVIAAIVLIVLVVVVLIFTGKIGGFVKGTENCYALGGRCYAAGQDKVCPSVDNPDFKRDFSKATMAILVLGAKCEDASKVCCKGI